MHWDDCEWNFTTDIKNNADNCSWVLHVIYKKKTVKQISHRFERFVFIFVLSTRNTCINFEQTSNKKNSEKNKQKIKNKKTKKEKKIGTKGWVFVHALLQLIFFVSANNFSSSFYHYFVLFFVKM